jgi:hypothetical protein
MKWLILVSLCACSDSIAAKPDAAASGDSSSFLDTGAILRVSVPESGRAYVDLAAPKIADGQSLEWDLAFEGMDVFTNSGPSGAGMGGSFGPLDVANLGSDTAPEVPFIATDKAGGAFLDTTSTE